MQSTYQQIGIVQRRWQQVRWPRMPDTHQPITKVSCQLKPSRNTSASYAASGYRLEDKRTRKVNMPVNKRTFLRHRAKVSHRLKRP